MTGSAAPVGAQPPIVTDDGPAAEDAHDAVVHAFARELVTTGRVSDARYGDALEALGEPVVVDLIALVGYYTLVAFTLNAREVPAPDGAPRLPAIG